VRAVLPKHESTLVLEPLDWSAAAILPRPVDVLARYRKQDPVHWGTPRVPGSAGCWYLTQYDDVVRTLRNAAVGHMKKCPHDRDVNVLCGSTFTIDQVLDRWFLFLDPPDHERLRSTVNKTLQSRARGSRPQIEQTARSMIASLPTTGPIDLLPNYAYPLSVMLMADVLGIPSEDCGRLIHWAAKLMQVLDKLNSNSIIEIHTAFEEFFTYIRDVIRTSHQATTTLGSLLFARDAGIISDDEVVATSALLLLGSAETIPTLIGNSILLLLQHPDQLALLRDSHDLIDTTIDEVLRFESPVQFTRRRAMADFELRGKIIRQGDYIVALYNSANRDSNIFDDAETFNITRLKNPHLGFGSGIHNCVGARLGHLIAKVAVLELITAAPTITLLDCVPTWRGHETIRGLQSLRVAF
jgi:pimeloyl-[acyl-carrier protein] synthase